MATTILPSAIASPRGSCRSPAVSFPISQEHEPDPKRRVSAKWELVFRKDHARTKKRDHDPIESNRIMIPLMAQGAARQKAPGWGDTQTCPSPHPVSGHA